jgi:hypothetical protein
MLEEEIKSQFPGVRTSARVQRDDDVSWHRGELLTESSLLHVGLEKPQQTDAPGDSMVGSKEETGSWDKCITTS